MHRFFRWFALFNALPVFLVAQEPALPAKEIFAKRPTGDLALEIYQSDDSDSLRAAVICLHGGGWKKGEPQHIAAFARELAGEGFVTIAPAYRLSDVAPFPAQIDDINAAIRWVRENANRYQIDPEKIGIIGSSAGGHLALLSATRPAPEIERPNAAIGLGAQTDFTAPHIQNAVEGPRHELYGPFLGGSFREAYHNYRDASPLHHLSHDDPPVGIISGELDQPSTRASRFRHEAMRLGIPTDLEVIANAPHALLRNAAFRKEAVATAREFFEKAFEEPAPVVESLSDSAPDFPKLQPWTRLGGGYSGCEGAQWLPGPENSGPILIYAAHHDGLFFRWSAELGLRLWIDETPETSTLRPTAGGSLIGVDQSTRLLRRFSNVGVPGEVLVEQFEEKRLNRPNDLRIHPTTKRIWFTDPNFLFRQRPLETQELPGQYVFCYSPSPNGGTLAAPIRDLDLPNGIAISRDGKALFVGDSKRRQVFRFQFTGPSSVAKREIFANFEEPIDGLAFSPQGHLWVAAGNGFSLLNENGEAIYRMTLNEKATSAAFFVEDQITHIAVTTREAAYVSRYSSQ